MSATLSALTLHALALPPDERAGLADCLLESLDESAPVDAALVEALRQRAGELRTGQVRGLTTEEAYGFSL